VILDIDLPGMQGDEILRRLRKNGSSVTILVVSGTQTGEKPADLLELGADDFMPKSSIREMAIRVRRLLHRGSYPPAGVDARVRLMIWLNAQRRAELDGVYLDLYPAELNLLLEVARQPRKPVARTLIAARGGVTESAMSQHLYGLRNALAEAIGEHGRALIQCESASYFLSLQAAQVRIFEDLDSIESEDADSES
jgi:DNA-binding response OmpR family regulator